MDEPVTSGVPLPQHLGLTDSTQLRLVDAAGTPTPAQFTPLARWGGAPDDSSAPIRWVLVDFQTNVESQSVVNYFLQQGGPGPAHPSPITVADGSDKWSIETGTAQFTLNKNDGSLTAPGLQQPLYGRINVNGGEYTTSGPVTIEISQDSPLCTAVQIEGSYQDAAGTPLLDYTARYWFYAGQSTFRLFHTLENNTPCPLYGEDGQIECEDINSEGSVSLSDLSLIIPTEIGLGGAIDYHVGLENAASNGTLSGDLLLYQDSSGTDYWDIYSDMRDWDDNPLDARPRMQSYVQFRGYELSMDGSILESGNQAPGWIALEGKGGSWSAHIPYFWQNFPKALRASPDGTLEIGLFPSEFGGDDYQFNLRSGEHKTHELWLSPLSPGEALRPASAALFAAAPPAWYVGSGAFGLVTLPNPSDWPEYEDYIRYQLETAPAYEDWMDWYPNLPTAIQATDFYGIFDFGDWPIDYEGFGVSPLNVKYDFNQGLWTQWARTGDYRWFALAQASDRHTADIDILHTHHDPRHWSDGMIFGHSYHDEEGFLNPHRNYGGASPDTAFGSAGLLLAYYLTGYDKTFEATIELADSIDYLAGNDPHLCPYLTNCSGEGWAFWAGMYDSNCRPAATSLYILTNAYRATGNPRYLEVSDAIVEWAHPEDQPYINGPTGESTAMKPWLLFLYLRSLADYIEMRREFGLPENPAATESIIGYVDWLRTYAWVDLEPLDFGPRASFPYEWWFDDRQGDPNDEYSSGNNVAIPTSWLLLGADAMAYASSLSGNPDYLEWAEILFRTGSRDPWYEGDFNTYSSTKETANGITFGNIFLYVWEISR
jgi:hypothetical protein